MIIAIAAMAVGIAGISMGVFSIIYMNLDNRPVEENIYVRFTDFDEGGIVYGDVTIKALIIGCENYTVSLFANDSLIGSLVPLIWDSSMVADGWWNLRIEIHDIDSDRSATDSVLIKVEQPIPTPGVTETIINTIFSEDSGSGNFSIVLNSLPDSNVGINVSSSDVSGAMVDGSTGGMLTLLFTPINWDVVQTVNLTGVNDDIHDGDQIFDILVIVDSGLTTDSTGYLAIDPPDITVTVLDDDTASMSVTPGITTFNENYGFGNCTVVLDSEPNGDVVINVVSNDVTEATIDDAVDNVLTLAFSPGNWSTPHTMNISGVNDGIPDGMQEVYIILIPDSNAITDTTGYVSMSAYAFTVAVEPIYTLVDWEGDDVGWLISPDNRSVQATTNSGPSIYYTNIPDTIGLITFEEWTTGADNDFIGCVLGYDPGDINQGTGSDYMVLYWGGMPEHQDLILRHYVEGSAITLVDVSIGWTQNVHYTWTIEYSSTRIRVWIDSTLRIDTAGTFDTGFFGFYVYSQPNTFFEMVSP